MRSLFVVACWFLIHTVHPTQAQESPLLPFETDFCTGFREGTRENPELWKHCCVEHDLHFWAGGCAQARREADLRLRTCIREAGAPGYARLIYAGVRLGSLSPFKLKRKKWGNAWKDGRGTYRSLSPEDILTVEQHLRVTPYSELDPQTIGRLLSTLKEAPCPPEIIKEDRL